MASITDGIMRDKYRDNGGTTEDRDDAAAAVAAAVVVAAAAAAVAAAAAAGKAAQRNATYLRMKRNLERNREFGEGVPGEAPKKEGDRRG